jgi:hypothetical protein
VEELSESSLAPFVYLNLRTHLLVYVVLNAHIYQNIMPARNNVWVQARYDLNGCPSKCYGTTCLFIYNAYARSLPLFIILFSLFCVVSLTLMLASSHKRP